MNRQFNNPKITKPVFSVIFSSDVNHCFFVLLLDAFCLMSKMVFNNTEERAFSTRFPQVWIHTISLYAIALRMVIKGIVFPLSHLAEEKKTQSISLTRAVRKCFTLWHCCGIVLSQPQRSDRATHQLRHPI